MANLSTATAPKCQKLLISQYRICCCANVICHARYPLSSYTSVPVNLFFVDFRLLFSFECMPLSVS